MIAEYRVREHNKTSRTMKTRKIITKRQDADRSSQECDAKRSEWLQDQYTR